MMNSVLRDGWHFLVANTLISHIEIQMMCYVIV